ncbi:MAG: GNAT family N-acetyltransferase [Spirochaetia bacterium]|nr:GNAT family N-acetyltransferase [Spirochaetia bacterium]
MVDDVILRKAEIRDADVIYNFICRLEGENPTQTEFDQVFRRNLTDPDTYYYLAEKNSEALGFISLQIRNILHHTSPIGEIVEMFVLPEYRDQGIGELLYWNMRDIAQEKGCKFFEVACNIVRNRALDFFKGLGLQQTHYKFTERL